MSKEKTRPDERDLHPLWRLAVDGEVLPTTFCVWSSVDARFDLAGKDYQLTYNADNMAPIAVPKEKSLRESES